MTKVAVREGRLVVPTCPTCGCRLQKHKNSYDKDYYNHFKGSFFSGTDARGCKCSELLTFFEIIDKRVVAWFK